MSAEVAADLPPAAAGRERWGLLSAFLMSTFYCWLVLFLGLWVAVPALGLGWDPVVVTSGSMGPMVRPGDIVLLRETDGAGLGPGTVVTFEDPVRRGRLVTHRIDQVHPDGTYRTRGDANAAADSTPVPPSSVVGVGRLLVPLVGAPVVWLQQQPWLFVAWLVVTVAAALVATAVPDRPDDGDTGSGDAGGGAQGGASGPLTRLRRRVGGFVARGRPMPGLTRSVVPSAAACSATLVLARSLPALLLGLAVSLVVLLADPRGPHLPVGRWTHRLRQARAARRPRHRPAPRCAIPRHRGTKVARPVLLSLLLVLGIASMGSRSSATFRGASSNAGNGWRAAASFCSATTTVVTRDPGTADSDPDPSIYDTFVDQASPSSRNGENEHHLEIRTDLGRNRRALLWLAVPSPPPGCSVGSATLRLWFHSYAAFDFAVARVSGVWDERTTSWDSQPAEVAGTAVVTATAGVADGYVDLDVTTLVQDWLAGAPNDGLVVRAAVEDGSGTAVVAHSKDKAGEPAQWPQLVVTWS